MELLWFKLWDILVRTPCTCHWTTKSYSSNYGFWSISKLGEHGASGSSVGRASDSRCRGPKTETCTCHWWWGWISPNQPYLKGCQVFGWPRPWKLTLTTHNLQQPGSGSLNLGNGKNWQIRIYSNNGEHHQTKTILLCKHICIPSPRENTLECMGRAADCGLRCLVLGKNLIFLFSMWTIQKSLGKTLPWNALVPVILTYIGLKLSFFSWQSSGYWCYCTLRVPSH